MGPRRDPILSLYRELAAFGFFVAKGRAFMALGARTIASALWPTWTKPSATSFNLTGNGSTDVGIAKLALGKYIATENYHQDAGCWREVSHLAASLHAPTAKPLVHSGRSRPRICDG